MLLSDIHILKVNMKECLPHPPRDRRETKTNILHTVGVKICHTNFLNNAVPALNGNIGGSTNLVRNWHRLADFCTLFTPLISGGGGEGWGFGNSTVNDGDFTLFMPFKHDKLRIQPLAHGCLSRHLLGEGILMSFRAWASSNHFHFKQNLP